MGMIHSLFFESGSRDYKYSIKAGSLLGNEGCPLSDEALVHACGYSVEAVKILVKAGCPLSDKALIRARGYSVEAVKILVRYRFRMAAGSVIHLIRCEKVLRNNTIMPSALIDMVISYL